MQNKPIHSLECWTYFEKKWDPLSQYAPHPWGSWIPLAFVPFTDLVDTLAQSTHTYFVKLVSPEVSKAAVREVVRECEECQSIDPAPVNWKAGRTGRMRETGGGLEWNVTHLEGRQLLNLNRLRSQLICYLEAIIMPGFCQHCSAVGDCIFARERGAC